MCRFGKKELLRKLKEYTANSKLYPVSTLEEFCCMNDITISELESFGGDDVERAIRMFKQKQKSIVMRLLTMEGTITLKNDDGTTTEMKLNKQGVILLAKEIGIGQGWDEY